MKRWVILVVFVLSFITVFSDSQISNLIDFEKPIETQAQGYFTFYSGTMTPKDLYESLAHIKVVFVMHTPLLGATKYYSLVDFMQKTEAGLAFTGFFGALKNFDDPDSYVYPYFYTIPIKAFIFIRRNGEYLIGGMDKFTVYQLRNKYYEVFLEVLNKLKNPQPLWVILLCYKSSSNAVITPHLSYTYYEGNILLAKEF